MTEALDTWAVLLAAGRGSRLGGNKLLLPLGARPVIEHALAAYLALGDVGVVAVVRPGALALTRLLRTYGARVAVNPDPERGMFSSICVGVAALPLATRACFIHPADIPLVSPATLRALRGHLSAHSGLAATLPTCHGRRGHPPLLAGRLIPSVLSFVGQDGLRGLLREKRMQLGLKECGDLGVLLDMDTEEDYRTLHLLALDPAKAW